MFVPCVPQQISIWDERKVFGSRGHILKEEFVDKQSENTNRSEKPTNPKLRQSVGNMLDKIVSDYEMLYGGELDEDALLSRCTSTISTLDKIVKDFGSGANSGKLSGSGSTEELQGQHASLRECIEQLTTLESSRASLVSHLRDALQEQELKLDRVRSQLQAAQLQSDQVTNVCGPLINSDNNIQLKEQDSAVPSVVYTRQASLTENKSAPSEDDSRKSAAAAVAAKLTASTSSAQMLSLALTSLVSGVAFGNNNNNTSGAPETLGDHQLEKRPKLENDTSFYASPPPVPLSPPPPLPPFPQNANTDAPTTQQVTPDDQPPPPSSSPPPLPPLPPMMPSYPMPPQFIHIAGPPMSNMTYAYSTTPNDLAGPGYPSMGPSVTGMSPYRPPGVPFQNYQVPEGGFYNPPSSVSMSHQQSL
ncbi:hypothetical protein RND81_11G189500 [Saponaria officinalis]|uniref:Uncharacterized protein n=1 Tax=Saponaria officinalis TaxID=3572 RepID=A0AAW1HP18_SAPOF